MAFSGPQVQSELILGGYAIYVSTERPIVLSVNGVLAAKPFIAIVPPYTKHRLQTTHDVRSILVEAETVSSRLLEDERFHTGGPEARAWAGRIEESFQRCLSCADECEAKSFDLFFFGERLPRRQLDGRVALAAERLCAAPDASASELTAIARSVALSPSRLRHLFREQVGVTIRRFRAWKRLRNTMQIALLEPNILKVAMAAGYADATHLCHATRLFFGKQPSSVCAHWRRELRAVRESGICATLDPGSVVAIDSRNDSGTESTRVRLAIPSSHARSGLGRRRNSVAAGHDRERRTRVY